MKAVVLAIVTLLAVGTGSQAATYVSGFNPRFGIAPSNPNNPDYRPPDRPRSSFDFDLDIGVGDWWNRNDRDRDRDRDRRPRRER